MTGKEVFNIWAPKESKWTQWVRPVPFIQIDKNLKKYQIADLIIPKVNYIKNIDNNTAIIVDLYGNDSIEEGIALAYQGFRPIPIYNGTIEQQGAMPTVDNSEIVEGLIQGAIKLKNIKIDDNANPAFLLDTNRINRYKMNASVFDNSWDIYYQDIPSADYFINNGINKILIVGKKMQKDLKVILYDFQKKGMEVFITNDNELPKKIKIKKYLLI